MSVKMFSVQNLQPKKKKRGSKIASDDRFCFLLGLTKNFFPPREPSVHKPNWSFISPPPKQLYLNVIRMA